MVVHLMAVARIEVDLQAECNRLEAVVAVLTRRVEHLEQRNDDLVAGQEAMFRLLANRHLGGSAKVALAVGRILEDARNYGSLWTGPYERAHRTWHVQQGRPDEVHEDGFALVTVASISVAAGLGDRQTREHIDRLVAYGVIEKHVDTPFNRSAQKPLSQMWLRQPRPYVDYLELCASLTPQRSHGGKRRKQLGGADGIEIAADDGRNDDQPGAGQLVHSSAERFLGGQDYRHNQLGEAWT